MEARIDNVTDARDTRPTFGILYRRYTDIKPSYLVVQADNDTSAMLALARYVGNNQYVASSITVL